MKEWQLYPKISTDIINKYPDINPVVLQLLANREILDPESIKVVVENKLPEEKTVVVGSNDKHIFYDPFLFKDMEKAVDLIVKHLKNRDNIVVYGDYDADGVTSSAVLSQALQNFGAQVDVYIPDRVNEGYGLNKEAVKKLIKNETKLIITVDTGVRNKEEIAFAQEQGLDVIVTDHHILPPEEELPGCCIINPANQNDNYPWPYLAGVGVAFKLVSALLLKSNLSLEQKQKIIDNSLDLVAIGTIADMVNILGENRLLVKHGLKILNQSNRMGIKELMKISKISDRKLQTWNISWQIAPRLNAASRLGKANTAFNLLVSSDYKEVVTLAKDLNDKNIERQVITKEITEQVEEQIDQDNLPNIIIGVTDKEQSWNEGIIGLVAGRISEKYYRPTLIITRLKDKNELIFKGSGRSIPEVDLIETIEKSSDFLDKYGGHPMACGFSLIGNKNLQLFKEKITKLVDTQIKGKKLIPKLKIEAELDIKDINIDLVKTISILAPFGQNNKQPYFVSYNLEITEIMVIGIDNQHIKFKVGNIWAIAFGSALKYDQLKVGDHINIVYHLDINNFNGRSDVQLKVIDIKLYE